MARLIKNRRCVMCGKNNVYMWTIDNMQNVVVTYLCKEDSAPLLAVMNAAGDLPPDRQVPMPERGSEPLGDLDIHKRGRRQPRMAPLLGWVPPTPAELHKPPPAPPEPEPPKRKLKTDEEKAEEQRVKEARAAVRAEKHVEEDTLVREARAEGKTWAKIGEMVGKTGQYMQGRYGQRYNTRGGRRGRARASG